MKKGQITIFVIVGIIILFIVFGFLFMLGSFQKGELETKEEKMIDSIQLGEYVQTYTQTCLEDVAKESIIYLAAHGGYEYGSNFSIGYSGENRPYYFYLNETFVPEVIDLKKAFSDYVNKELIYCMAILYEVEKGYNLTFPSPNVKVDIMEGKIDFQVDFNLIVEEGDVKKEFNVFETTIPTSFLTLYQVAENLSLEQVVHPEVIITSNLIDLAEEYGLQIDTITISDDDVIYLLKDENNKIEGESLEYVFAFKYDW
jgi:hypothetical protein